MSAVWDGPQSDDIVPSTGAQEIVKPPFWLPIGAAVAFLGSAALIFIHGHVWSAFIGYLLAPLVVIVALTLAILHRNQHAGNHYYEYTTARRNIRRLTILALLSLVPATFHSLQIARDLTLWLAI